MAILSQINYLHLIYNHLCLLKFNLINLAECYNGILPFSIVCLYILLNWFLIISYADVSTNLYIVSFKYNFKYQIMAASTKRIQK